MEAAGASVALEKSASEVYKYIFDMQFTIDPPLEILVTRVSGCDVNEGCVILHALRRLPTNPHGIVMLVDHPEIGAFLEDLMPLLKVRLETRDTVASLDDIDMREGIVRSIYGRQRPAADLKEYADWSDPDLTADLIVTPRELESLRSRTVAGRISSASLIVSTPHQFISRFRPRETENDDRLEMDVDRIFLDEAGYCGPMQAATLFINGVSVTFLGDHMQLDPVS